MTFNQCVKQSMSIEWDILMIYDILLHATFTLMTEYYELWM